MNKLRNNHLFLSSGTDIKEICKPLQFLNTHLFTYMKNFHDGTQIYLSSEPQWVEDYFSLKLYESSYFEGDPASYVSGFKWWPEASDLPVFTHGRDYYDSRYGITLCQQTEDGCEFYFFSSGQNNKAMMDVYLNNLDLLEAFAVYFKEAAAPLLRKCDNSKINRQLAHPEVQSQECHIQRELFLQHIGNVHPALERFLMRFEKLTPRERECLNHIVTKSSTTDVAAAMGISIRTAETHIQRILDKLHFRSKNELIIELFAQMNQRSR
jgi:DNA-binding CsgD family transcriptional regulator